MSSNSSEQVRRRHCCCCFADIRNEDRGGIRSAGRIQGKITCGHNRLRQNALGQNPLINVLIRTTYCVKTLNPLRQNPNPNRNPNT